jgi:hypothetical protein
MNTVANRVTLDERGIPAELLPQARAWFALQMNKLEKAHGPHWPANREWLVDYLNEELRERAARKGAQHGV